MKKILKVLTAAVGLILAMPGCNAQAELPTVDGPETTDLVGRLRGYVVTDDSGGITATSLPDRTSRVVYSPQRTPDGRGPTIHSLSGPDGEGRIAYIEDYFFVENEKDKRHLLKSARVDRAEQSQIFSRPGSAMWATSAAGNGEIGSHIALAPTGGNIAFISRLTPKQMPGALLNVGSVEIWNLDSKAGRDTQISAIDEPMSWFPDGERLVYTGLVDRTAVPIDGIGLLEFGNYFGEVWDQLPAIHVYDLKRGENSLLCVGWQGVVSHDGKTVFVGGWGGEEFYWLRVDIASGKSGPLNLPGIAGPLLGDNADGSVLYIGLPTTGEKLEATESNSPLRGPKLKLSIKVATAGGDRFQTIVKTLDPRSGASFGMPD